MSTLPVLPFGALLRRARLTAWLSQEDLAERAHLTREAISPSSACSLAVVSDF